MPRDLDGFAEELVASSGDLTRLLDVITRRVVEVIGEAAVLTVLAEDRSTLQPAAFHHPDAAVRAAMKDVLSSTPYRVGEGIVGTAAADRRPVVLSNVEPEVLGGVLADAALPFVARFPIHSIMTVPLVAYGELLGTLGVMRLASTEPYSEPDLLALQALAERAALALEAAHRGPRPLGLADYAAIFRHSLDGVLFTVPDGRILAANPAACAILRRSEAEICRVGRAGLLDNDDPQVQELVARRALSGSVRAEVPMRRGDGTVFTADMSSAIFPTPEGELRACVIFRDVSEHVELRERLKEQREQLERLVELEPLSGLLNRRGFTVAAERALAFAEREDALVQLVFIDLDDLKGINDRHGHRGGDAVLARLGEAISGTVRTTDVAARLSGDEFALLLYGATSAEVDEVLDRIHQAFEPRAAGDPAATFSAGVAGRGSGSRVTLAQLLDAADQHMYSRKVLRRLERNQRRAD